MLALVAVGQMSPRTNCPQMDGAHNVAAFGIYCMDSCCGGGGQNTMCPYYTHDPMSQHLDTIEDYNLTV